MYNLKENIINEIIHQLTPLRTLYNEEVDMVTNDILNNNLESLRNFINKYYQDVFYSESIKKIIYNLINSNIISSSYLNIVIGKIPYTFLPSQSDNYRLINSRPLNIKTFVLESFRKLNKNQEIAEVKELPTFNIKKPIKETKSIQNNTISNNISVKENKTSEKNIDDLRAKILEAQLNYLKDATGFIANLQNIPASEIYSQLLNLNDIRYMQHSISKLDNNTLEKLLEYVSSRLNKSHHNSIDMFMEEAIKKSIHDKK